MRHIYPRVTCPICGRSVAIDPEGYMYPHNKQARGDGALFMSRRLTYNLMCAGSGRHLSPDGSMLR